MSLIFESEIIREKSQELHKKLREYYLDENEVIVNFELVYRVYIKVDCPAEKMILGCITYQHTMSESVNVSEAMLYNQAKKTILSLINDEEIPFKDRMGVIIYVYKQEGDENIFHIDMKEYLIDRLKEEEIQKEKKAIAEKINKVSEKNKLTRL